MLKQKVIEFFGSRNETAAAIGCTPQAVSLWPEVLSARIQDRVIAAAYRMKRRIPQDAFGPAPEQRAA